MDMTVLSDPFASIVVVPGVPVDEFRRSCFDSLYLLSTVPPSTRGSPIQEVQAAFHHTKMALGPTHLTTDIFSPKFKTLASPCCLFHRLSLTTIL